MAETTDSIETTKNNQPDLSKSPVSQDRLADLTARATALYAVKDYLPAAELYAAAAELQAESNGEMSTHNADLLYSYGKCLYFVAVKTSDVLGNEAAGGKLGPSASKKAKSKKRKANGEPSDAAIILNGSKSEQLQTRTLAEVVEGGAKDVIPESDLHAPKQKIEDKPFFQLEDDDESDSDSDDEAEGQENGEDAEEEDDFALAFEVLDLSRVLLLRKLEQLQSTDQPSTPSNSDASSATPTLDQRIRQTKDRLSDIHDLQAEISLESEKFAEAVTDLRASLAFKTELHPAESSILAECHYKLSLALEFASVTQQHDPQGQPVGEATFDQSMRDEAATQMESAIISCEARITKEENELDAITDELAKSKAQANIADVKEIVSDMHLRLDELHKPPVDVQKESAAGLDKAGIMAQILGGNETIEGVSAKANDLSGMVKRKKKTTAENTPEPSTLAVNGNGNGEGKGKRKATSDEDEEIESVTSKKAKVEDADDAQNGI